MFDWFMVAVFDDNNNVHESCGGAFDPSVLGREDLSRDRDDAVYDVTWMVSGSFP